jgi:hypothetical protein
MLYPLNNLHLLQMRGGIITDLSFGQVQERGIASCPLLQEKLPIAGSLNKAPIVQRVYSVVLTGIGTSMDFCLVVSAGFSGATVVFSVLVLSTGVDERPDGERWSVA